MSMNVNNVNTRVVTPTTFGAMAAAEVEPKATVAPLLGGASLTVAETGDVEKLAALLLEQTNRAREEAATGHLKAVSDDDVLKKLYESASLHEIIIYTTMSAVSKDISSLKSSLKTAEASLSKAGALADNAQQAYNQALANGSENVEALRVQLQNALVAKAAAQTEVTSLKTQIAAREGNLDALVGTLGGEGYRRLAEALMEGADDLQDLKLLEDETEDKEGVGNYPLDERSVVSIIRDSLRRLDGDLLDSLATRREAMV